MIGPDVEIARLLSSEPCIMFGCRLPSEHEGQCDFRRCDKCNALLFAELSDCRQCSKRRK